jgi:hypothetical protein
MTNRVFWLPEKFRYVAESGTRNSEYSGTFRWRELRKEDTVLPQVDDDDWLAPLEEFLDPKDLLAGGQEFQYGNVIRLDLERSLVVPPN